jgi:hypothetical protein
MIVHQPIAIPITDVVQVAGWCMRTTAGAAACLTPAGQVMPVGGVHDAVDVAARDDAGCLVHAAGAVSCWFSPSDLRRIAGVRGAVAVASRFAWARHADRGADDRRLDRPRDRHLRQLRGARRSHGVVLGREQRLRDARRAADRRHRS